MVSIGFVAVVQVDGSAPPGRALRAALDSYVTRQTPRTEPIVGRRMEKYGEASSMKKT